MKEMECDVIQDLLPSYVDKIASKATNRIVEEHLRHCNKCTKTLEDMNKKIDTVLFNQNEQIDYLKGFKKEKKIAIIKTICICIIIILVLFLFFQEIVPKFNLDFEYDATNGKEIYITPIGKFTYFDKPSRTFFYFNINNDTERVFLKDKKGNIKEIWNKDNGILIK